jgi:hypothetical protein
LPADFLGFAGFAGFFSGFLVIKKFINPSQYFSYNFTLKTLK